MLTDEEIRTAYRNPKTGLTGLHLFARHIGEDVERVKKVLLSEDPYTLNKNTIRHFPRKLTYSPHFFNQLQIDLMDVSPWAAQNDNVKFLFIAIDVFSRYVWVYPIKNKSAETVLHCLKQLIASEGKIPKYIQTDEGKEFFNTSMNKFCAENDIIHFHTYTEIKCALAERFIRTLRMRLTRLWDIRGTFHYLDVLPEIIEGYNNGYHSTIKTSPAEARKEENNLEINETLYAKQQKPEKPKFTVGQHVRILMKRGPFTKELVSPWSREIYTIASVNRTGSDPYVYTLKDFRGHIIKGIFYTQELSAVNPPEKYGVEILDERPARGRRQKQYLVKWVGYETEAPEWINADQLENL